MRKITALQSIMGGIAASIGLELFLHPHELIAGGITGISAMVSFYTEKHFGVLLLLFNLPLLLLYAFLGYRPVVMKVLPGLLSFSGSAFLLTPLPAVSGEPVIAALAGGLCLGVGAGLAVKSGGFLDSLGLEKHDHVRPPAIMLSSQLIPMEYLLLICHGAVLVSAGVLMGWERTLYSALACLAAYETSALVLYGLRRTVWVTASNPEEVRYEIKRRICLDAGIAAGSHADMNRIQSDLHYRIHILDIPRFKAIIRQIDPHAEVIIIYRPTSDMSNHKNDERE
ncbi:YitT family protein [Paenibacillus dokdonensis]|uniref:YitT family protein n=1 Tax=Paenibacillus dokdonensis TaxID=2567944 RepID=UPI001FE85D70|nr:YitT family protein [Paenibacillus dokdonensis]